MANYSHLHIFFLLSFILLFLNPPANSQAIYVWNVCSTGANYTAGSTYQTNLNLLLSSLKSNAAATGYFNDTKGQSTDQVFGLALCRGDISTSKCQSCLNTSISDMAQRCPRGKSSAIWYDECFVRYSNESFFSSSDSSPKAYLWNTANATDPTEFNSLLGSLMYNLTATAVRSASLFADGDVSFQSFNKIYGLVQCTRDLSVDQCNNCLRTFIPDIQRYNSGKLGGRILGYSCSIRFESNIFYDIAPRTGGATDSPSISTAPSGGN